MRSIGSHWPLTFLMSQLAWQPYSDSFQEQSPLSLPMSFFNHSPKGPHYNFNDWRVSMYFYFYFFFSFLFFFLSHKLRSLLYVRWVFSGPFCPRAQILSVAAQQLGCGSYLSYTGHLLLGQFPMLHTQPEKPTLPNQQQQSLSAHPW